MRKYQHNINKNCLHTSRPQKNKTSYTFKIKILKHGTNHAKLIDAWQLFTASHLLTTPKTGDRQFLNQTSN